jgi:hypothetical protein
MGKLAEKFLALINRSELPMNARHLKRESNAHDTPRATARACVSRSMRSIRSIRTGVDQCIKAGGMANAFTHWRAANARCRMPLMAMPTKSRHTR